MNEGQERRSPWTIAVIAALFLVLGLAAVVWPELGTATRAGGGVVALVSGLVLGWAVLTAPTPLRRLAMALIPGAILAVALAAVMPGPVVTPGTGGSSTSTKSGAIRAPEVTNLDELYAQALDIADQLVDDGATTLRHVRLNTDLRAGSRLQVIDGAVQFEARLATHPQREWQWEATPLEPTVETFNGHEVTFSFDPVIDELGRQAEGIGITPAYETVWIDPGLDKFQPLATANPDGLPVAQFNSTVRGRDLRPQVLGDGTLPGTFFDVRDRDATLQQITDALLLDARGASTAEFQVITARTPTTLLDGPAIDDRPTYGGVQFLGTVDGDYLQVTVGVGQFPTIHARTPDNALGFLPLSAIPDTALTSIPASELPVAWQLRAEKDRLMLRAVDQPGAPEQIAEL